jgi:hypothetical protein
VSRSPTGGKPPEGRPGRVLRPTQWHPPDRHVSLGVSHPSDDPSRHRVFEVRAVFDPTAGGWVAHVGEQDRNEQRGAWRPLSGTDLAVGAFPTAAACLGDAVAAIVLLVDQEVEDGGSPGCPNSPPAAPRS